MAIASLLKEVLNEVEALSSSPEDLEAYIKDRRRITQAIVKVRVSPDKILLLKTYSF